MKPNVKLILRVDGESLMEAKFNVDTETGNKNILGRICDAIGFVIKGFPEVDLVEPIFRNDE